MLLRKAKLVLLLAAKKQPDDQEAIGTKDLYTCWHRCFYYATY